MDCLAFRLVVGTIGVGMIIYAMVGIQMLIADIESRKFLSHRGAKDG